MVHYKYFYLPVRGRGDAIRHMFMIAGVPYEEVTISLEDWPKYKSQMPLGQVPVLEVEGVQIAQSTAILRFLGNEFQRAGKNNVESARLDMIAEVVQEMTNKGGFSKWCGVLLGSVNENKDDYFTEKMLPSVQETAPIVEKFLADSGTGLFIGDKETWVDLFVAETFSRVVDFGKRDALDAFPRILQLIDRIHNIPAVKKFIAERPAVLC